MDHATATHPAHHWISKASLVASEHPLLMFARGFKKIGTKDQQGRGSKDRPHPGFSEKERVMPEAKQRPRTTRKRKTFSAARKKPLNIWSLEIAGYLSGSEIHRIANGATVG